MKALTISKSDAMVIALQEEIHRSKESRYYHRLHAVLLVAQGLTCTEASKILGDSPRTVQYWIERFEENGFAGLTDSDRPGRPWKLEMEHIEIINQVLHKSPRESGFNKNIWDGKTLSAFIKKEFSIDLGVRQCQRLFRQHRFKKRRSPPVHAKTDFEMQDRDPKTYEK